MTETTRLRRSPGPGRGPGGRPPGGNGVRRPAEEPANPRFFARSMITKG
ncbi:hypothetical protein [Streptomyces griseoloalbus]|uniref:Uncharacterized protein n=1 Tax=Streptomyces griseoloalbus TaxID=67303 RepID=A0A7W8BPV7_9ACTN|nr:hypothetical protein [Streptomyces albaduncus]MBB5127416.1 hypothetical protein [Streptomyces albaduncus]GGW71424.1 hypothetical protein GCM10010340_57060 [Streptomyces albaduncus]